MLLALESLGRFQGPKLDGQALTAARGGEPAGKPVGQGLEGVLPGAVAGVDGADAGRRQGGGRFGHGFLRRSGQMQAADHGRNRVESKDLTHMGQGVGQPGMAAARASGASSEARRFMVLPPARS